MQEQLFYISELIGKELNGTITVDEATILNKWVNSTKANKTLFDQLHDEAFVKQQLEKFDRYDLEKNRAYLMEKLGERQVNSQSQKSTKLWKRIAVAASIVGMLFVGYWLLRPSNMLIPANDTSAALSTDVAAPDKNRAQIRLANGTTVYLDSMGNGSLASQNGVLVIKTADGRIEYSPSAVTQDELQYNTLFNPKGSKVIDITLSDGSRLWLNAGSSITYPVAFVGNERKVTMTGEAYFEVAKDALKRFSVEVNGVTTEVLGTHFNINSYTDEKNIKVTLLEGSVKVHLRNGHSTNAVSKSIILKPGQQASEENGKLLLVNDVDVDAVVAWKNGYFQLSGESIQTLMRQIARWYDVEIVYEGKIPERQFGGQLKRSANLSEVLRILQEGNVHCRIEGRKVIVSK